MADGAAGLSNLVASHVVEECNGVIEHAPIQGQQMAAKNVLDSQVVVSPAMRTLAKVSKPRNVNYPEEYLLANCTKIRSKQNDT